MEIYIRNRRNGWSKNYFFGRRESVTHMPELNLMEPEEPVETSKVDEGRWVSSRQ